MSFLLTGPGRSPGTRSLLAEEATSSIDMAMAARLAARKAVSVSSSASTGLRDMASAKKLVLPGQCTISNFHMLILCLIWKRRTFGT